MNYIKHWRVERTHSYKLGFVVQGKHRICDEEWLFQEKERDETKLVFYGYDANLMAMPNLSERPHENYTTKWFRYLKQKSLEFAKNFNGEVWLDDVKIK